MYSINDFCWSFRMVKQEGISFSLSLYSWMSLVFSWIDLKIQSLALAAQCIWSKGIGSITSFSFFLEMFWMYIDSDFIIWLKISCSNLWRESCSPSTEKAPLRRNENFLWVSATEYKVDSFSIRFFTSYKIPSRSLKLRTSNNFSVGLNGE